MCSCGCRGWCSLWPIHKTLQWQLESLAHGIPPPRTHTGDAWPAHSPVKNQGPLGFSCVLIYLKGDWAEQCHSLGLGSWAKSHSPCQFCVLGKAELFDHDCELDEDFGELPYPYRTKEDYARDCLRCEVVVQLRNNLDRKELCDALRWTRDKTRIGGRVVYRDTRVNGVLVVRGDRLE
eukprot:5496687-Pyramimonas_sp.AAC.1